MGIKVEARVRASLGDEPGGMVLLVRAPEGVAAAARALEGARPELERLLEEPCGGPPGPLSAASSPVVIGPDGPLLRIMRAPERPGIGDKVAGLLAARLEAAGLPDATIDAPRRGGALDGLESCANAVVLRVFPPPAGPAGAIPPGWVELACEWALGDLAPEETVGLRLLGLEYRVPAADAAGVGHHAAGARAWCDLVTGELAQRLRTASFSFGATPHLALGAGGPGCDTAALLARFEVLAGIARELGEGVAYACVDFEPTFEGIGLGVAAAPWRALGGAAPDLVTGKLVDLAVPDAFPFQVIGKGHLERLGRSSLWERRQVEPLGGGRFAVAIGEPLEWLPGRGARAGAHEEAVGLLERLLLTEEQAATLLAQLPSPRPGPLVAPGRPGSGPDLAAITLEALPHPRRGLRLTLLELVSWLAHEPHSDEPASVAPVLATFARWFAAGLDSTARQELKRLAGSLAGTAPAGEAGRMAEDRRAWLATDWLVRAQARVWLELAGLDEAAARLAGLGPITDALELVRAVDALASATALSSRRVEIIASIAGAGDPSAGAAAEQAAWDAWERSAEASGWVAASEAAVVGVPEGIAYSTDQRVLECARDPRARDELAAARRSIGDAAWSSALQAAAREAWAAGWSAARAVIDAEARIGLAQALERASGASVARAGIDEDQRELAMEAAEAAARDSLTRAALRGGELPGRAHPWDVALAAARSARGGELWGLVHDLARGAVEPEPWESGMDAARRAVEEALRGTAEMVPRVLVGALAREAASSAARGVALRAAAAARGRGGEGADSAAAAEESLRDATATLQRSARWLLERLVEAACAPRAYPLAGGADPPPAGSPGTPG